MSATTRSKTDIKQRHILDALVATYPNIHRRGWRSLIGGQLAPQPDADWDADEFADYIRNFRMEPDAVAIEPDLREPIFFEVEVHNPMSDRKLKEYGKFAIDLISFDIVFALLVVNRHGHINAVDLLPHYGAWLEEAAA